MKTLLSLFDYSGQWSQPFEDAGWNVIRWDIKIDELMDINLITDASVALDTFDTVDAIMAGVPCTDFAVSGARWFAEKDADGRTAQSIELVRQVQRLADVSYGYAITAHKSQGSTYTTCFVDANNIQLNPNVVERNRILYTAITRAKKQLNLIQ